MSLFKTNNILKTCLVVFVIKIFLLGLFIVPAQISTEEKKATAEQSVPEKKSDQIKDIQDIAEKEDTVKLALFEKKEEKLKTEEARIEIAQKELEEKIYELTNLREEIEKLLKEKEEQDEQKIQHLVKIYSSMKGQEAAQIIERLPDKTVIAIFLRMKSDQVAKILPSMSKDRAIKVTQLLSSTDE